MAIIHILAGFSLTIQLLGYLHFWTPPNTAVSPCASLSRWRSHQPASSTEVGCTAVVKIFSVPRLRGFPPWFDVVFRQCIRNVELGECWTNILLVILVQKYDPLWAIQWSSKWLPGWFLQSTMIFMNQWWKNQRLQLGWTHSGKAHICGLGSPQMTGSVNPFSMVWDDLEIIWDSIDLSIYLSIHPTYPTYLFN